jgi:hypothetical protein
MKTLLTAMIAVSIVASFPGLALAQAAPAGSPQIPAAELGINEQLDRMSARIDREVGSGQLSQTEAVDALREVSSIEDAADADREEHGGQLPVADHLEFQTRIDHLKENIRHERTSGGTAPTN